MAPRRTHTRQHSDYCDSVHTLMMSPRGSSFIDGTNIPQQVVVQTAKPAPKGPLRFIMRAFGLRPRSQQPKPSPSRQVSAPRKQSPPASMSAPESTAVRRLLAPPSHGSLVAPSETVSLNESSASASLRSRTSVSSYHTAMTSRSRYTPRHADPIAPTFYTYATQSRL